MSLWRTDGGRAYVNPSYGKPKPRCTCPGHQFGTPHAKDCPRYKAPSGRAPQPREGWRSS